MSLATWFDQLAEVWVSSAGTLITFLPKLVGAFALLLVGYLLSKVLEIVTRRILRVVGTDRLLAKTALSGVLRRAGIERAVSDILALIVFWVVFLLFTISAAEVIGLLLLSNALTSLALYLPRLGLAIVIILLGLLGANVIREVILVACRSVGVAQGTIIAQAAYVAIILMLIVTAINELGIDTALLNTTIVVLVTGLIGGAALSFGLGARSAVANLIAAHYLRDVVRVGQDIRVGDVKGRVAAVTNIAFIVDTAEGRVIIPAAMLTESMTRLDAEGA